jgi:hypothetical protein
VLPSLYLRFGRSRRAARSDGDDGGQPPRDGDEPVPPAPETAPAVVPAASPGPAGPQRA